MSDLQEAPVAAAAEQVTVTLLDREFHLSCVPNEKRALLDTVKWLNQRLEETRQAARGAGNERVALMVALNLAHELRENLGPAFDVEAICSRIQAMQARIDEVLGDSA